MKQQIFTALALATLSVAAAPAFAKTIAVKAGDSIQDAVDSASSGDRILLRRGVHNDAVTVSGIANLKFVAQRGAIWDGYNDTSNAHFDILTIEDSPGVVVQGLYFRNGDNQIDIDTNSTGVRVLRCRSRAADENFVESDSDGFRGERNFITGAYNEPFDLDGDDIILRLNRMRYCGDGGIELDGDGALVERNFMKNMEDGPGIEIESGSDNAVVQRNTLINIGGLGIDGDGDDAVVRSNRIRTSDDDSIEWDGDDVQILFNRCSNMFYIGVDLTGENPIVRGNTVTDQSDDEDAFEIDAEDTPAIVENNRASDIQEGGFVIIDSDGGTIRNNRVRDYGNEDDDAAFDVTGDDNEISNCVAMNGRNDAFIIDGDDNTLTRCTARNIDEDGFVIESGSGNTIDRCTAIDCTAEGLQNDGTGTVVTNSRFLRSRLDVTNSGSFATFSNNRFTTGGETTLPEID